MEAKGKLLQGILLLASFSVYAAADYDHTIYIDPSTGADSPECLTDNSQSSPCANLTWVFNQSHSSSTHYVLSGATHYLKAPTPAFQDLNSLALTGNNSLVTCTQPNTGLAFINVANIQFQGIVFTNCSAIRNSTSKNFLTNSIMEFRVALYLYLCESVSMSEVSVLHSPNATGVVLYDTNGTNTFTRSNFSHNTFTSLTTSDYPGGGGFYVEFTYCEPGMLPCQSPTGIRNNGASYTFTECEFSNNRANNTDDGNYKTYIVPYQTDHQAFGHGGGLSLFVKGDTSGVTFSVLRCTFMDNSALWGGGFFLELHDNAHSNKISVNGSMFVRNECLFSKVEGTEGGGIKVGHYVYGPLSQSSLRNEITIENSFFSENSALHGGGVSVSIAYQVANNSLQLPFIRVLSSDFEWNVAKLGSAVNVDRFGGILKGSIASVEVQDCTFGYNSVEYAEHLHEAHKPHQVGVGAVHVNEVPVWFRGNITFQFNVGSALSVIGSIVNFTHCRVHFTNNTGDKGAAIALLGAAYMQISTGTWMAFEENSAVTVGGAIYNAYISRENLKSDSDCFVRHTDPFKHPNDWGATFIFAHNTDNAGRKVNAIHSTSIFPCAVPGGSGTTNDTDRIFCWNNWVYSGHFLNCEAQVTSDIGGLILDDGNEDSITVYSGWQFELPVSLEDDLHNSIDSTTFAITYNDTKQVTYYRKNAVVVEGFPEDPVELSIETLGNRVWHFEITAYLKPCPPGFRLDDSTNLTSAQCVCSGTYGGAVLCDETSKTIQLLSGMWMGKLDEYSEGYVVMDCPLHFCGSQTKSRYISVTYESLPKDDQDWNKLICGATNRNGTNCGQCIDGYGLSINSLTYECVNCTDINLAVNIVSYLASVYLPLAALFTVLILFDIRLTTGPANAFILYCQVVTSTFDLNADGGIPTTSSAESALSNAYRLPFGIFNLKFIENYIRPICLTADTTFNSMSVFVMDYAVALFPLFMIILVVLCLKISETCCLKNQRLSTSHRRRLLSISRLASTLSARNKQKKINDALLPAFASFVLLSYTKFSITSSYILNDQHPVIENGTRMPTPRVYYASQLKYDDPSYFGYFIPAAIVCITIVSLVPLILLDYPLKALEWCVRKVPCLKRIYPSGRIHMFLNMFQGCYRSKMRFFAGMYFLFRFVINISYVLTDTWLQQFLVQQAATTIMIAMLAVFHPYEWWVLNYVDILIFTNMALLNGISFYLFSFSKIYPKLNPEPSTVAIQYFLVFLPLFYMVSYVVWNISRPYHARMKAFFERLRKPNDYEPLSTNDPSESELQQSVRIMGQPPRRSFVDDKQEFEDDYEAMFSRAKDQNSYMPSLSKSVTVVEVSGKHTEGEANAFQTTVSRLSSDSSSSGLRSSQDSPGRGDRYGATSVTSINS